MTARPWRAAMALISSMSAGWPYSDTGMMARVRGVISAFDQGGVDVAGGRVDVDEHRHGAQQHDGLGGGDEGERRGDDFVAGPMPSAISAISSASVPEATVMQWRAPV
jgi:hypothetical protein